MGQPLTFTQMGYFKLRVYLSVYHCEKASFGFVEVNDI